MPSITGAATRGKAVAPKLKPMSTAAILTAAGSGVRLGQAQPKALVEVAGLPMIVHAARALAASGVVDSIIATAPSQFADQFERILCNNPTIPVPVTVLVGGDTRQESVNAALTALDADTDVVLVHDAARPFASPDLVRRVTEQVRAGYVAVVPSLPVTDTIKQVTPSTFAIGEPYRREVRPRIEPEPGVERVAFTPNRENLRQVQTPQGFERRTLDRAYAAAIARSAAATDDAGLVEAMGFEVVTIPGEESAAKITTARDLRIAELLTAAGVSDQEPATAEVDA